MNVLVTGGAGFRGLQVVQALREAGFTPIVYDNLSTGVAEAVPETVQLVQGDVRDVSFTQHLIARFEVDAVVHCALVNPETAPLTEPERYYVNNVEGTLHLLQAVKSTGVPYFIYCAPEMASTGAETDAAKTSQVPAEAEEAVATGADVYARTTQALEGMLRDYAAAYELRCVTLHQPAAKTGQAVAETLKRMLQDD